jgi:N-methylhydantoinase A
MTDDRRYRIGIDVGGTFTDFVMADRRKDRLIFHKEPSVPLDPAQAIARGIAALLEQEGASAGQIEVITHGTTLGLNAIIQERGCRVALIVSAGNRDVMELARGRLPSSYNFRLGREKALVGRRDVFEVSARMLSDGEILRRTEAPELDTLAETLRQRSYDAVAVMLLNSYADPAPEATLADALAQRLPGVPVTASAQVWPEVKEYERALIAVLNAYIHPLMSGYFDRLSTYLADMGVTAALYITSNNGGTMSLATARARPVDTILSGPSSGVSAAARLLKGRVDPAKTHLLTFDMGGTSSDVSSIIGGLPEIAQNSRVGDYPLMLPVVSVAAVGAGGGSIGWRDAQGVLKVGPHSAGASPGPVSYGRGGTETTITDALVAMGVLHPDRFLNGRMPLNKAAAEAALDRVGTGLGLADAAAVGRAICRVATVRMATEITKLLAQKGLDVRDAMLVAFGGAGPTTALMLAEEAGIGTVIVPPSPGTFCALGALLADVQRDFVRSCRMTVTTPGDGQDAVDAMIAGLHAAARDWIGGEGALVRESEFHASADMRYPGQSFEFRIPFPENGDLEDLTRAFHAEHQRVYGFRQMTGGVEIVNLRLTVTGRLEPVTLPAHRTSAAPVAIESRRVLLNDWTDVPVLPRAAIPAGATHPGPMIVEQADTTTLVLPGWNAEADTAGTLWLRRGAAQ